MERNFRRFFGSLARERNNSLLVYVIFLELKKIYVLIQFFIFLSLSFKRPWLLRDKNQQQPYFILNLALYFIVTVISAWAVNHGIKKPQETASVLSLPARIFPIYFPMGNMATGFFVILSLLAGVVGCTTSLTGLYNVFKWNGPNLHTASASSLATWALTLLAMGFACKEIDLGWTCANLRTLEAMTIIVSGTQMFSIFAVHAGV